MNLVANQFKGEVLIAQWYNLYAFFLNVFIKIV